jgi:DNA replication protein
MASKNTLLSAVDFRYILLDSYKKLGLSEEEVVVILLVDHLLEQGNDIVTADSLSLKMNYKVADIDRLMVGLVNKGYLSYETMGSKMYTSLDNLKTKLYDLFSKNLQSSQASLMNEARANRLGLLVSFYEDKLGRTLSPLESSTIGEWADAGYSDDEIKAALIEALRENKRNLRAVDKILRAKRQDADIAKEGYSGVSPSWNKDIQETMALAKTMWSDDDKSKK